MLSLGLHLRMIGRPGRIGVLDRILWLFFSVVKRD
jgi:hypothetical protein